MDQRRVDIRAQLTTGLQQADDLLAENVPAATDLVGGIVARPAPFLGHVLPQAPVFFVVGGELDEGVPRLLPRGWALLESLGDTALGLVHPHRAEVAEHLFFAREVVEEGALGDVGAVADLIDGGGLDAVLAEELESRLEDPLFGLLFLTLTARNFNICHDLASCAESKHDHSQY